VGGHNNLGGSSFKGGGFAGYGSNLGSNSGGFGGRCGQGGGGIGLGGLGGNCCGGGKGFGGNGGFGGVSFKGSLSGYGFGGQLSSWNQWSGTGKPFVPPTVNTGQFGVTWPQQQPPLTELIRQVVQGPPTVDTLVGHWVSGYWITNEAGEKSHVALILDLRKDGSGNSSWNSLHENGGITVSGNFSGNWVCDPTGQTVTVTVTGKTYDANVGYVMTFTVGRGDKGQVELQQTKEEVFDDNLNTLYSVPKTQVYRNNGPPANPPPKPKKR
jgi:hypothetical protein